MNWKIKYLGVSTKKFMTRQGQSCPSCLHADSVLVSRKYIVTSLRRCSNCQLLFRVPVTTPKENAAFYQDEYQEVFTTDMPTLRELDEMKEDSFAGTPKDFSERIRILKTLSNVEGGRLCDYGCSWGYGSWQFSQSGFNVQSFEISRPRAEYAKTHLGVDVVSSPRDLTGPFDVFFSSHVLEHVPSVQEIIDIAFRLLRPGGYFVAFTPNGSSVYREKNKGPWRRSWGMKHPNLLDDRFYRSAFKSWHYYISSSPFNCSELTEWAAQTSRRVGGLYGGELMIIACKQK